MLLLQKPSRLQSTEQAVTTNSVFEKDQIAKDKPLSSQIMNINNLEMLLSSSSCHNKYNSYCDKTVTAGLGDLMLESQTGKKDEKG